MKSLRIHKYKLFFSLIMILLFFQAILKVFFGLIGLFPTGIILFIFFLYLLKTLKKGKFLFLKSIELKILLIYYFYVLMTICYSNNILVSLVGFIYELKLLLFIIFLLYFYCKIKDLNFIENILYIMLIIVVLSAIIQKYIPFVNEFLQKWGGYYGYFKEISKYGILRPNSILLNLFDYAFVSSFLLYLSLKKIKYNKFHYIVFLIALYGVMISFTRSGWILIFIFLLYIFFTKEYKVLKMLFILIGGMVLLYIINNQFIFNYVMSMVTLEDPLGSAKGHLRGIINGFELFQDWWLGYGLGLTSLATQYFKNVSLISTESSWISLLDEIGIIGTFLYFLFLFVLLLRYPLIDKFYILAIIIVMVPSLHIHYSNIFMLCLAFLIVSNIVKKEEKYETLH